MADRSEIVMVSTYRPPVPKEFRRRKRRWPGRLLALILACLVAAALALGLGEIWLGSDPRLPVMEGRADYRPKLVTELRAASGEPIGEIAGERRRMLTAVPPALAKAIVERKEPGFFERGRLGQLELLGALYSRARGQPDPSSITRALAHRLAQLPDGEGVRWMKEWLLAIRLERHLGRGEILELYLHQVPFAAGRLGAEEGARARFGRAVAALSEKQLGELAAMADSETFAAPLPLFPAAPEYAGAVARELGARFSPDELSRLGATVTSDCDLALTRAIQAAIRRQKLEPMSATVIVQSAGTHEVRALVGPSLEARRPIGSLRAPLVLAAALVSKKWHAASPLAGERLRVMAQRDPQKAAQALFSAGLSERAVNEAATDLGAAAKEASPREWASVFTSLASLGVRRQPQLIRALDGQPESEIRKTPFAGLAPEAAWLVNSFFPLGRASGFAARDVADAWFAAWSPEISLVVRVGFDDGRPVSDSAKRAAQAIGAEILRALPTTAFLRPAALQSRRLDAEGQVQPSTATVGTEEWFLAGSLPREDPILPPE